MNINFAKTYLFIVLISFFQIEAADLPDGFGELLLAENLDPVSMAIAPDGRVFIAEKNGRILIVRNDALLPDPFIQLEVDNFNERGLSGIAFDPHFEQNNYLYVFYTVSDQPINRVSRVTANGDFAIPGSEVVLLETDPLAGTIHNGGAMKFGLDGFLYIATGDGSNPSNSQSLNSLHGKFLRIARDGSIPEDNPFYDQLQGVYRSIYALGFRNPFTFDIDQETGKIFANDVGGSAWEEINEVKAGRNYGWPTIEGVITNQTAPENYEDPVFAYSHADGCAIVGGTFYRPDFQAFPPQYSGRYFYSDYCRGYINMVDQNTYELLGTFADGIDRVVGMTTSPDGSLYYLERGGMGGGSMQDNTSSNNGRLWKVVFTGSGEPFISRQPQNVRVAAGETARFEIIASGEQPLTYQWFINGEPVTGETASVYEFSTSAAMDSMLVSATVTNTFGSVQSQEAMLTVVAGSRPIPVISQPLSGATYRAGDMIQFAGSATDPEDGVLDSDQLTWWIDFHHDDHTHPALAETADISQGQFEVPRIGEVSDNVFYRIYLRATDSDGLSAISFTDVMPVKSQITLMTEPTGLQILLDGRTVNAPFADSSVVGVTRTVGAPLVQLRNDTTFIFTGWKERTETDATIQFDTPDENITFIAEFDHVLPGDGDGLIGFYYNNEDLNFESGYQFWRLDPVIDFEWGGGSPNEELLGNDFFLIRWEGEVEAQFSGNYNFYTVSDDGVRLEVNNTQVIDAWIDQGPTEHSGNIALQAGEKYPIKLEYYERGGGAMVQLLWGFNNFFKEIIPTSQLYSESIVASAAEDNKTKFTIYPNPAQTIINLAGIANATDETQVTVHDMNGAELKKWILPANGEEQRQLNVGFLQRGMYLLLIKSSDHTHIMKLLKE